MGKQPSIATGEEVFLYLVEFMMDDRAKNVWPKTANLILRTKSQFWNWGNYNPVEVMEKAREYNKVFEKSREEFNKLKQKRRHERRGDFALSYEEWEDCKASFDNCCSYCGEDKKLTYDHFVPFSKGGAFTKENIVPACSSCNSSKHNKEFAEWYSTKAFYSPEREERILGYIEMNQYLKAL